MVLRTLFLVAIVAASWWYDQKVFPLVAFLAAAAWLTPFIRGKETDSDADTGLVKRAAEWLGYGSRAFLRSFRMLWRDMWLHVRSVRLGPEHHKVELLVLSTAFSTQVPFCFVVRTREQVVREATLVENSRIPGTPFEYELARLDVGTVLEAASNLTDLMTEVLGQTLKDDLERASKRAISLQQVHFNGTHLVSQLYVAREATALDMTLAADLHVRFHLTLEALLENVSFKAPL